MKKMEYQDIINGLGITAISCLIWAIFCFVGIGIATHKRDKEFEKSQIEYKKKIEKSLVKNKKICNHPMYKILGCPIYNKTCDGCNYFKLKP